jgi:hypothetical protein
MSLPSKIPFPFSSSKIIPDKEDKALAESIVETENEMKKPRDNKRTYEKIIFTRPLSPIEYYFILF